MLPNVSDFDPDTLYLFFMSNGRKWCSCIIQLTSLKVFEETRKIN